MKITRLFPNDVPKYWTLIRRVIISTDTAAKDNSRELRSIYESMLKGEIHVWIAYEIDGEKIEVLGLMLAELTHSFGSNIRDYMVRTVYSFSEKVISMADWKEALEAVLGFAKLCGCHRVLTMSQNRGISQMLFDLGGTVNGVQFAFYVE